MSDAGSAPESAARPDPGSASGRRPVITITLNPALDISTEVGIVTPEHKLRCEPAAYEPGGGGINVARVARRLAADAVAVAVLGGSNGQRIVDLLDQEGVTVAPVMLQADTRQSFSVTEQSTGRQFRFVLPGPPLDDATIDAVIEQARQAAVAEPIIVVSGSVPPGAPPGATTRLVEALAAIEGAQVVVDTSGPALREALAAPAMLIKPSARELAALVDRSLDTEADMTRAAVEVVEDSSVGAILASIGSGGAILARKGDDPVRLRAPTVQVRSAVGAGDSLVGGVAVGLSRGESLVQAAALGVAAGTAAVCTEGSELCDADHVEMLLPLVVVT